MLDGKAEAVGIREASGADVAIQSTLTPSQGTDGQGHNAAVEEQQAASFPIQQAEPPVEREAEADGERTPTGRVVATDSTEPRCTTATTIDLARTKVLLCLTTGLSVMGVGSVLLILRNC